MSRLWIKRRQAPKLRAFRELEFFFDPSGDRGNWIGEVNIALASINREIDMENKPALKGEMAKIGEAYDAAVAKDVLTATNICFPLLKRPQNTMVVAYANLICSCSRANQGRGQNAAEAMMGFQKLGRDTQTGNWRK